MNLFLKRLCIKLVTTVERYFKNSYSSQRSYLCQKWKKNGGYRPWFRFWKIGARNSTWSVIIRCVMLYNLAARAFSREISLSKRLWVLSWSSIILLHGGSERKSGLVPFARRRIKLSATWATRKAMVEPVVEALRQLLNLQRAGLWWFIKFPRLNLLLCGPAEKWPITGSFGKKSTTISLFLG